MFRGASDDWCGRLRGSRKCKDCSIIIYEDNKILFYLIALERETTWNWLGFNEMEWGEKGSSSVCTVQYGLNILETDIYWLRETFYRRNVRGFRALDILPIGMRPRYIHNA